MREIILDTETTGLDPQQGHRIIEIGCLEIFNGTPTGNHYHAYINPERDVPPQASAISGLTTDFLKPFPVFSRVVDDFLSFIGDDPLVIHNATFDMKFINAELSRLNKDIIPFERSIDTLYMARRKFPGAPASLDALCKRFNIDLSKRTKHGALIDAELLAEVYLELLGGRQRKLELSITQEGSESQTQVVSSFPVRRFPLDSVHQKAHDDLLTLIKDPLWKKLAG